MVSSTADKPHSRVDAEEQRAAFLAKGREHVMRTRQRLFEQIHHVTQHGEALEDTLAQMGAELSSGRRRLDVAWTSLSAALIALQKLLPDWEQDEPCWKSYGGWGEDE